MIAAVRGCELCLLVTADGADDRCAKMLGPLTRDQPDAAGGGVKQDRVTSLHPVSAPQQVVGGHALEHHGRRDLVAHTVGHLDEAIRRHQPHLGVGAHRRRGVSDAIAGAQFRHPVADRLDHTARFEPRGEWQLGWIEPDTEVDIDEIEPDGAVAQAHLSGTGLRDAHLLPLQDLGATGLVYSYRGRHCSASCGYFHVRQEYRKCFPCTYNHRAM